MKSYIFFCIIIVIFSVTYVLLKNKKVTGQVFDDVFRRNAKLKNNSINNMKNSNLSFLNVYPEPEQVNQVEKNREYVNSNCNRSNIVVNNLKLNNLENVC